MLKFITCMAIVLFAGCCVHNAEHIRFDAAGHKTEQTRTGQMLFLYWFGVGEYGLIAEPGYFQVTASDMISRPDPNSIEAAGNLTGKTIGTAIREAVQ